jgi:hypothetical protein
LWHSPDMVKAWGAAAALMAMGCLASEGGRGLKKPAPPSKPVAEFPSPAALAVVEAKPAVLPSIEAGEVPSEGWSVEAGADAASPEAWAPHGPFEEALAGAFAASGKKAVLTRPMACVAGELGRFTLAHKGTPPESLRQFIDAVCGVFAPHTAFQWLSGPVPASATEERVLARWRDQLRPDLVDHLPPDARQVGFWYGRKGGKVVVVASYETTPVELKPISVIPDANGDVVVEGKLLVNADAFVGLVNQGRFGVAGCAMDPTAPRPQFRAVCRIAPEDESAWLQVAYIPPRSVLATPIVQLLARRDVAKPLVFAETPYAASRPIAGAAEFGPAVLAGLNTVRAEAHLGPVTLADAQSAAATRVARQYFAAAMSQMGAGTDTRGDLSTIALGLLAGWQVTGTIRDGNFFSVVVPRTRDAGRWLDAALTLPLGRKALLARDIEQIAVGPALFDNPDALGGVVCGYAFHHGNDHSADVAALYNRIAAARQKMGLPPPGRLGGLGPILGRQLARIQQEAVAPLDALRVSLQEASARTGTSMSGYIIEATSMDVVELPPQIVSKAGLTLEIAVTHHKPPGAAWAQLVIVVIYAGAHTVET